MLSREDSRRLAQMERQLLRDDPEFCARMAAGQADSPNHRRQSISMILTAVVAWMAAAVLGVLGWWIAAAVAAVCATTLLVTVVRRFTRGRPAPGDGDLDI